MRFSGGLLAQRATGLYVGFVGRQVYAGLPA
jgi:hypothetical protein